MSDDLLSKLEAAGDRKKKPAELDNPVRASAGAVVRTSFPKSRRAGKYVRTTATLLPETLEELEEVRQQIAADAERSLGIRADIKMTDVIRMMVTAGLEAWKSGKLEPDVKAEVIEPTAGLRGWKSKTNAR